MTIADANVLLLGMLLPISAGEGMYQRQELTAAEVAQANTQAIASIHSLVMFGEFYSRTVRGESLDPGALSQSDLFLVYTWTWRGVEQRLKLEYRKDGRTDLWRKTRTAR
jgi:hypothetical protein